MAGRLLSYTGTNSGIDRPWRVYGGGGGGWPVTKVKDKDKDKEKERGR
jgi:hypothetical protein